MLASGIDAILHTPTKACLDFSLFVKRSTELLAREW